MPFMPNISIFDYRLNPEIGIDFIRRKYVGCEYLICIGKMEIKKALIVQDQGFIELFGV
jgi:hypothetical protein